MHEKGAGKPFRVKSIQVFNNISFEIWISVTYHFGVARIEIYLELQKIRVKLNSQQGKYE